MNNNHWKEFYRRKKAEINPSEFAKFVQKIADKEKYLLFDLGCGNGRDSVFFAEQGHDVISVDHNGRPYKEMDNLCHWKMDIDFFIRKLKKSNMCHDKIPTVIYSRFFIHAINKEQATELVRSVPSKTYFIAEFRIKGDEPKIYKDHKRTLWDNKEFYELFDNGDWETRKAWFGRGFAKYKEEDPLVMRIIAKKK